MPLRNRPSGQVGKRDRRSLMAAAGTTSFFIRDGNSGNQYLVDTGAQLSVLPATEWDRRGHHGDDGLKAANQANGLVVNLDKCELGVSDLDFLAHRVSQKGIKPKPETVANIQAFPTPKDKPSLQRFLGMINYYHR